MPAADKRATGTASDFPAQKSHVEMAGAGGPEDGKLHDRTDLVGG
jgi:hypothetical protein